ncbi:hypothetical protein NDU88_002556 [Pleurodeles waltl]|uniref:Uncharacterized protein n=1 Tax=Pleurodeles waltl TaxID=8319 RepID=A0AAV7M1B4_PLEWA|nr:hypothetical protein NDU88_002556 [Pleurodeles waltl]
MEEIGNRVAAMDDHETGCEEEVEWFHQEVLHLKEQHVKLHAHVEDLENRSRQNNVRIRVIPTHAQEWTLENMLELFFTTS